MSRGAPHSREILPLWVHRTRAILSGYDALSRTCAAVAELADAPALGAGGREAVWVRFPPAAPRVVARVGEYRVEGTLWETADWTGDRGRAARSWHMWTNREPTITSC